MVNPISFGPSGINSQMDFAPLAQLGTIYQKAQQDAANKAAFAAFQQSGDPSALLASGDMSLAKLGIDVANRQQDAATAAATRKDALAHQKFMEGIATRTAKRADEDKFTIKEVTNPDGTTSLVRIKTTGSEGPIQTGLPPTQPGGLNPKSPFGSALLKEDAARVAGYSDAAKLAEEGTSTLDQIDALRTQAFTAPILGPLAAKVGHPATQALEGATNQLSLDVAQKMKGSLSDKDIAFVKSQVPTAATGGLAGESASGTIRAGFERTKQRASFYRTWAETNGNINGADMAWSKYINENPLTIKDDKSLGGRKFNPNYNKDFSGYIRGSQARQQGITQQQYDALPPGSTFIAPDGSQRVKP